MLYCLPHRYIISLNVAWLGYIYKSINVKSLNKFQILYLLITKTKIYLHKISRHTNIRCRTVQFFKLKNVLIELCVLFNVCVTCNVPYICYLLFIFKAFIISC